MTEVQIWSIAVAGLAAAIIIIAVAMRRHRKRAHPHGHIVVDMTVPRKDGGPASGQVAKDGASGGAEGRDI